MLSKLPMVQDGRVIFRKKPGRAKYMIAVVEMEESVHVVLYRMSVIDNNGERVMAMSFKDFRRR
jgi:hypothetical protein